MRDIVLTLVIFGTLPFILWRPHIGVLVWTWIGFMNPHRLTWSWAYDMPFAMIVALTTLVSLLISREPKKIPWTRESVTIAILLILGLSLLLLFVGLNSSQRVQVNLFYLEPVKEYPVSLVVVVALILGAFFAGVIGIVEGTNLKLRNHQMRLKVRRLEAEIQSLQTGSLRPRPADEQLDEEMVL